MTKPFDSEVLLAKIKATLNRNKKSFIPDNDIFEFDFSDFNFNSKLRILTIRMEISLNFHQKKINFYVYL